MSTVPNSSSASKLPYVTICWRLNLAAVNQIANKMSLRAQSGTFRTEAWKETSVVSTLVTSRESSKVSPVISIQKSSTAHTGDSTSSASRGGSPMITSLKSSAALIQETASRSRSASESRNYAGMLPAKQVIGPETKSRAAS